MSQKESQGQPLTRPASIDWARLDALERAQRQGSAPERESRQQLLARKRQNNSVRRREFAHLRKLRQGQHKGTAANGAASTQFQGLGEATTNAISRLASRSSLTSRLTTPAPRPPESMLEQIDAIEAQISQQWFASRSEAESVGARVPPGAQKKPVVRAETRAEPRAEMPRAPGPMPPLHNIPLLKDALSTMDGDSLPASAPDASTLSMDELTGGLPQDGELPSLQNLLKLDKPLAEAIAPAPEAPPLSMDELMGGLVGGGGGGLPQDGELPSLQNLLKLDKPWDGVITRPNQTPGQAAKKAASPPAPARPGTPQPGTPQPAAAAEATPPAFLAAQPEAAPDFAHYAPFLYEAAAHFANNDLPQAESSLRALLVLHKAAAPAIQLQLWLALVQLYRASNHAPAFEHVALELARRFGRSPPQWFAMLQERLIDAGEKHAPTFRWQAPAQLDATAVLALQQAWNTNKTPWTLDWGPLVQIQPDAAPALVELLEQWVRAEGHFVLLHVQTVLGLLQQLAPSAEAGADAAWWQARMLLLRMLGDQEEFDSVALDYCVTYEVSPPWWEPPLCTCAQHEAPAAVSAIQAPQAWQRLQWAGIVEGDVSAWLQQLPIPESGPLVLDCSQLTRMDGVAAKSLLRWLQNLYAHGHTVQLLHLHLLLAAFLHQHGVGQYAQIAVRSE